MGGGGRWRWWWWWWVVVVVGGGWYFMSILISRLDRYHLRGSLQAPIYRIIVPFLFTIAIKFGSFARNFFAWFENLLQLHRNKRFWHLPLCTYKPPLYQLPHELGIQGHHTHPVYYWVYYSGCNQGTEWKRLIQQGAGTDYLFILLSKQVNVNTKIWKLKLPLSHWEGWECQMFISNSVD